MYILPFKVKGFQDLGEVEVVCVLTQSLKFNAFKLVHVAEDHDQVFAQ